MNGRTAKLLRRYKSVVLADWPESYRDLKRYWTRRPWTERTVNRQVFKQVLAKTLAGK